MLWFVTHLPLLNLQIPGGISLFMKEFLSVLRLEGINFDGLQYSILYSIGLTSKFDYDNITDRGHTLYFEQMGYNSRFILRNLEFIIVLLMLEVILILISAVCELNAMRDMTGRLRRDIHMSTPSFASMSKSVMPNMSPRSSFVSSRCRGISVEVR